MKSKIGMRHIRSNSEGRITQALPAGSGEPCLSSAEGKTSSVTAPSDLVAVVVHVERDALDTLIEKGSG